MAVCPVAGYTRGIGKLRLGFTHRLGKPIDALLSGQEGGPDAISSPLGDHGIGGAADVEDGTTGGGHDPLVIFVIPGGVMPEGAVVVHLDAHERGGTGGTFERGAVELDDQPVGQSRPIGVAKDENPAGIDIVIGFDQGDEILDKGHIGGLVTVPVESKVHFDRPNERWEVFAEITLSAICENSPIQAGSDWLVSFSRYDYTRSAEGMTFEVSTSPHKQPSFHRQQEWTLLILEYASESLG